MHVHIASRRLLQHILIAAQVVATRSDFHSFLEFIRPVQIA